MNAVEDVLSALAVPIRRELLERLSVPGCATATTLADEVPVSRQPVVQHLTLLDFVGLVWGWRQGRERRIEVRSQRLTETARWMEGLAARWDRRLAGIRKIAEMGNDSPVQPSD